MDYMCFNGATSFQKWIGVQERDRAWTSLLFQWSHFFSEMDRIDLIATAMLLMMVSMEPLLFRNG